MSSLRLLEDFRSAQGIQSVLATRAPQLAVALVAILLAIQAGYLLTLQDSGPVAPLEPRAPGATTAAGAPVLRVDALAQAHLFGQAAAPAASADAPLSAAQLVLAGVLSVPDPRKGMAIIGPTVANAKLYAAGATVGGGLALHSVYPDRVLLDRGGVLETLLLPKKLATQAPPAVVAAGIQSPGQRLVALAQNNDGALLGGLVRAQPVFNGGKLSGYRIFPGGRATSASFNQLGLRSGDMITAVNGTPLDDPSHANEILQTLSSSASATISVLRNGQPQDLNLNLETVASDAERAAAEASANQQRGGAFAAPVGAGRLPGLSLNPGRGAPVEAAPPPPAADEAQPPPEAN
jgi:general secretion pathway protein C